MDVCLRIQAVSSFVLTAVFTASVTVSVGGQQIVVRPSSGTKVGMHRPGTVVGTAWNHDNTPIAHALLRLRDVTAGEIASGTRADGAGRFTFAEVRTGSYVVELVDHDGRVLGVGQMFSMAPAESVATFIRLNTHVPWYSGFFGSAAAAALTSAAALGVTAVDNGGQPASPRF